jgi:uncharacterized delta-60 repeat protein
LLCAVLITICRLAYSQTADSFDPNPVGYVETAVPAPDGRILAAGNFATIAGQNQSYLARFYPEGSLAQGFASWMTNGTYGADIQCLALHTNGQILIGGTFYRYANGHFYSGICRLNADGSLDTSFSGNPVRESGESVNCLMIQPDNKIIAAGPFTFIGSSKITGICRFNWNGDLDTNFNAAANGTVKSIALQPDGKIVAVGSFTSIGGKLCTNLARLNADGSIDPSFQTPVFACLGGNGIGIAGSGSAAVQVQPDGKILVGAMFDKVNGLGHTNIVRLNGDGSVDTSFNGQADESSCEGVQTLSLQADGKIIVGDDSLTLDRKPCPYLGRLNPDGSLDATFSTRLVTGEMVYCATLQADGDILVAGVIYTLAGAVRYGCGRLINTEPATQSLSYDGTNIT